MKIKAVPAILGILLFALSCSDVDYSTRPPAPVIDSIDISEVIVALPDSPGRALVEKNCITCHSLRFIEMQPAMSRKSWEKIVTKMVHSFGAPMEDSAASAEIVDYLMRIKGEPNNKPQGPPKV